MYLSKRKNEKQVWQQVLHNMKFISLKDILKLKPNFLQLIFPHVDGLCVLPNYIHKFQFWAPIIVKSPSHSTFLAYLITCYKDNEQIVKLLDTQM